MRAILGGALVLASSLKQKLVAKSSTQAELEALSSSTDGVIWAKSWLEEKGVNLEPIVIYQDNQASIRLGEQGYGSSQASRHWNVRHFYVKQAIEERLVTLQYVKSEQMIADPLTKPYPRDLLAAWRNKIGIRSPEQQSENDPLGSANLTSRVRGVLRASPAASNTSSRALPSHPASCTRCGHTAS